MKRKGFADNERACKWVRKHFAKANDRKRIAKKKAGKICGRSFRSERVAKAYSNRILERELRTLKAVF